MTGNVRLRSDLRNALSVAFPARLGRHWAVRCARIGQFRASSRGGAGLPGVTLPGLPSTLRSVSKAKKPQGLWSYYRPGG